MVARATWLGHATVLLELAGARFLTDPVLRARVAHLRRHGRGPALPTPLDAVLLSHLHLDHADVATLRRLEGGVPVVAPRGSAAALRRARIGTVHEVAAGDVLRFGDATVTAVPALHDTRRRPFGARSDALGFVVAGDGHRVYFAGDTDLFDGMAALAAPPLDVALLPVWGWGPTLGAGHLDPARASGAAALLRPAVAVPIHWGTYLPAGLARRHGHLLTDPGHAFARHVATDVPGVRVEVLAPGEALTFAGLRPGWRRTAARP